MKKRIVCLVLALLLLGTLTGCALFQTTVEDMDEADAAPYYSMGEGFLTALFAGDYAACSALCSEDLRNQMSESDLQSAWENMRLTYGDPVSVAGQKPYWINGEGTVVYQVACAHGGCSIQLTYDADNNVAGLWFGLPEEDFPYEVAVPEGVTEIEITLGEGTDTPLKALVTLPADAEGPVPGVVLVHGSGANDRNEAIGGCYPFADLAHGLAQRGIASIRYDKRTYTYGNSYTEEEVNAMTARRFYDYCTVNCCYRFVPPYFTKTNIPEYFGAGQRGDCGMHALLFITLCRCAGIPAQWQAGLYTRPGEAGCHDWARFYVAPYGWLYCDASFGGSAWRAGSRERWNFYFGNLEPFRMVANRDLQQDFDPPKKFLRADPYDSQLGEAEYEDEGLTLHDFTTQLTVLSCEVVD